MPEPIVSRPGEGELHKRGDGHRLIRADLEHIGAIEIDFDETLVVPPHTHADHTDSFFVLEGEVKFTVGDEEVRARPGTWLSAPPGARHGFGNGGSGRARVLNIHAPDAGFAAWIRDA